MRSGKLKAAKPTRRRVTAAEAARRKKPTPALAEAVDAEVIEVVEAVEAAGQVEKVEQKQPDIAAGVEKLKRLMDVFAKKLADNRFDLATMTPSDVSMALGPLTRAVPKGSDDDAELAAAVAHNLRLVPAALEWGPDDEVSGPFLRASEGQVGLRVIAATAFLIMYFEFMNGGGKRRDEVLGVALQVVYDVLVKKAPATPTREGSANASAIDDLLGVAGQHVPEDATSSGRSKAGSAILKTDSWKPEAVRAQLVDRLIVVARTTGIYTNTPVERTEAFEAAVRAVAGPEWQAEFMLPAGVGPETVWNVFETVLVGEKQMEPPGDGGSDRDHEAPLRRVCEAFGVKLVWRDTDREADDGSEAYFEEEGDEPVLVDDLMTSEGVDFHALALRSTGVIGDLVKWCGPNLAIKQGSGAAFAGAIVTMAGLAGGNYALKFPGTKAVTPAAVMAVLIGRSGSGKDVSRRLVLHVEKVAGEICDRMLKDQAAATLSGKPTPPGADVRHVLRP